MRELFADIDFAHPFAIKNTEKYTTMLQGLNHLSAWHSQHCKEYANIIANVYTGRTKSISIEDVPYLPVQLFKYSRLASLPDHDLKKVLISSGTTGQHRSVVLLDSKTAQLQIHALASIVQSFVGKRRLPFVNLDQNPFLSSTSTLSARVAAFLGFSNFGHHHFHFLDENQQPRWSELCDFLSDYKNQPILLFGFTSVVWENFIQAAKRDRISLNFATNSVLIHGGGWKKLSNLNVDNSVFKAELAALFGIHRVINYYGMVEQVGSIFMECEEGYLHTPSFADVLIRDQITLRPAKYGLIQVLSLIPRSYPGHSILTEDLGTLVGVDNCLCGRLGRTFQVHGRIPSAELRGCSDTIV
jgi:hypothetical protein